MPLTEEARAELVQMCSIPGSNNPQAALAMCPAIEKYLGEVDRYCDAIDVIAEGDL